MFLLKDQLQYLIAYSSLNKIELAEFTPSFNKVDVTCKNSYQTIITTSKLQIFLK